MERSESFFWMLRASAKMQHDISLILEAKANEAEKSRDWICVHLNHQSYDNHEDQLKKPLEMHESFVELIDGLTKMENALAKNLKVVLNKNEDMSSDGMGGFGSLFGGGLGDGN
ncbi:restriction endonuclease subunit S [Paenibacillus hemerocallicola]|uniref:Restriction endonuclease subunit S n=1 Tax=Paenibacillus hemerocallicola TaxID=1172614 RepID=A0A5C4TDG4_9BACL|nr:restriction endonuclease subunit S [Paenibacillus hemerocallicola]TNJ66529.1 restriction endonuclease subunit S [Paenibacillus hemerocallicola]